MRSLRVLCVAVAATIAMVSSPPARSDDIVISQWGNSLSVAEFAVAIDQGFLKAAGAPITGVVTTAGGGTAMRSVLAANDAVGYGVVSLTAAVEAIRHGEDVRIVNVGARSAADTVLMTRRDSPINSMADMRGKSVGITNPLGWSDTFTAAAVQQAGLPADSVRHVALGTVAGALTGLMSGAVDVSHMLQPTWQVRSSEFKLVFDGRALPPIVLSVGVATGDLIRTKPELLRAIVRGRRDAVRAIKADPAKAAENMVRYYKGVPVEVMTDVIKSLNAGDYWSEGAFDLAAMNYAVNSLRLVGAFKGDVDWSATIDDSFLPK